MVVGCREGVNLKSLAGSTILPGRSSTALAAAGWLRDRSRSLPWWTRAGHALLPPRCVLCGGDGDLGAVDLCGCCLGTLPFVDPAAHRSAPAARATFAPFLYRDPVGSGLRALKFRGDLRPARVFGALLAAAVGADAGAAAPRIAALVPVPLHRTRHAERGFNQAEVIARHAGRWLGSPVRSAWLRRARATRPQTGLRGAERRRNLIDAFEATPALHAALDAADPASRPFGRIVVLDDVLTTGATAAAARTALLAAGVPTVEVWAVARVDPRREADAETGQARRSA